MLMARLVPACRNSNNKTPGYFLPFSTLSQRKTSMQTIDRSELSNLPAYAAPVTELEGQICSAFSLGTGVSPIGLDDDIFDLGGDSLIAEVISIKLSELFERAFAASMFINFGTPRSISNWAEGLKA